MDAEWHRFVLRVEGSPTQNYEGVIELWCDGLPISTVTGQIGLGAGLQWFKIGPYRDKSPLWEDGLAAIEFRSVRRGTTLMEVA